MVCGAKAEAFNLTTGALITTLSMPILGHWHAEQVAATLSHAFDDKVAGRI